MRIHWLVVLIVVALTCSSRAGGAGERTASPDGKLIAFVKPTPDKLVDTASEVTEATEIWTSEPNGANARLWLRGKSAENPEEALAGFAGLQFSPDGTKIYFLSLAWVTSGAVHVLDLRTGKEEFVCPGNSLEVIHEGEYKGDLMVRQHLYFLGGGSFDWLWLLRPNGEEIGPIAADDEDDDGPESSFRKMYMPNSLTHRE